MIKVTDLQLFPLNQLSSRLLAMSL